MEIEEDMGGTEEVEVKTKDDSHGTEEVEVQDGIGGTAKVEVE